MPRPAKVAEVGHYAFLPEQGVKRLEIERVNLVERCALARRAYHLALVVDRQSESIQVAGYRRELPDVAFFPGGGLVLEHLRARAARVVPRRILRTPGSFTPIIDLVGYAVVASQRWKRGHDAVFPQERGTGVVEEGNPKGFEAAKILAIRIWGGSLRFPDGLAPFIDTKRDAVQPPEPGCADLYLQSFVPEGRTKCAIGAGRPATYDTVIGDGVWLADAHKAEISYRITWWLRLCLCYSQCGEQAVHGNQSDDDRFHVFSPFQV